MTVKVYYYGSKKTYKKAIAYMEKNNVEYVLVNIRNSFFSWGEFLDVLKGTKNGLEDLISTRSNIVKQLRIDGLSIDAMTLKEFYEFAKSNHTIFKSLIIVGNGVTLKGHNEDEMSMLLSRSAKKKIYEFYLKKAMNLDALECNDAEKDTQQAV